VTALAILGTPYFPSNAVVSIACEQVSLRGQLKANLSEVRYTTDGSEPTEKSARYSKPFMVKDTTTVKAAIFHNGRTEAKVSAVLTKGTRPVSAGSRRSGGDMGAAEDPINTPGLNRKNKN
jgi:N-acetyl-beta-hexosaminidase